MDALIKLFEKYFMRDLAFIVGGGSIILCILKSYNKLPSHETPIIWYIIGSAFSYVLGYTVQDSLGLFRLVRMKAGQNPCCLERFLFRCYDRKPIKLFKRQDYDKYKMALFRLDIERYKDDFLRLDGLKQIAFAIGPSFFISGVILFLPQKVFTYLSFQHMIAIGSIICGLFLWCLGFLKVTQQAQYIVANPSLERSVKHDCNS